MEFKGDTASSENPFPDSEGNSIQMSMTRKEVILGIRNSYEWFFDDVPVGEADGFEERTVRPSPRPLSNTITGAGMQSSPPEPICS